MSLVTGSKGRMYLRVGAIILLTLGVFILMTGDAIAHTGFLAALSTTTWDNEQYPNNGWQVRWGVNAPWSSGEIGGWTTYWYTTYRPAQKWTTDYMQGQVGPDCIVQPPYEVWFREGQPSTPIMTAGMDLSGSTSGSPCTSSIGAGSPHWFGYVASRTVQFSTQTNVHVDETADSAVKVTVTDVSAGSSQIVINTWIGHNGCTTASNCQGIWDGVFGAGKQYRLQVEWAKYGGPNGLISNSWDYSQGAACQVGGTITNIGTVYLIDKATNTQQAVDITNPSSTYTTSPSFTLQFVVTNQACIGHILRIPVSLYPTNPALGYTRTPNYYLTSSDQKTFSGDFNNISPNTYFLNVGAELDVGIWWGLSFMRLSFISPSTVQVQGSSTPAQTITDWLTPLRTLSLAFIGLAIVMFGITLPRKRIGLT